MSIASARPGSDQPMMEMNTTPLIDVMLVLLIMFIITIPVATSEIEVDLGTGETPKVPIEQVANRLVVTHDNQVLWNGFAVSSIGLARILKVTKSMRPEPELQFRPEDDASYDLSAKTLVVVKRAQISRFGFVGNERFAEFGKATAFGK